MIVRRGIVSGALVSVACCCSLAATGGCARSGSTTHAIGRSGAAGEGAPRVPVVVTQPRPFRIAQLPRLPRPLPVSRGSDRNDAIRLTTAALATPGSVATPQRLPTDPTAASPDTDTAIRAALQDYLRAFNLHDPVAVAAHWTTQGTSVDLASGAVTNGRDAVRRVLAALFAEDASATIDLDITAIRPVRDDVAVVDGVTRLSSARSAAVTSRFSAVMVREAGQWRLESMHEAPQMSAPAAAPEAAQPLDDLAWLRGAWEDVGEGITAGTNCFWSNGRGFLVRTHAIAPDRIPEARPESGDDRIPGLLPAGPTAPLELTEIIGWDSDREEIRSWLFTSTGRFAEGTWRREGDAWKVHVVGQGRDTGLACVCTLRPDGADGLMVTCDTDSLAHLLPAACRYVRTTD